MPVEKQDDELPQGLLSAIKKLVLVIVILVIAINVIPFIIAYSNRPDKSEEKKISKSALSDNPKKDSKFYWNAPDVNSLNDAKQKEQVEYGKDLIAHTAKYLGPNGRVLKISNGMNCQNCHLQAGTAVFANNYGSVASLYPKFRARSGSTENIYKRVNDCFERSLNGKAIDTAGKEMQAIVAYIKFLGTNVEKGKKAEGSGFKELAYLDRAAEPNKGQIVYTAKCKSCHQANGEGVFNADKTEYTYPALWGKKSYNDGAGMYRMSNIAKYVKYNMPMGTTYLNPQLTDEEAWDVAAFVNSQQRPQKIFKSDWPNINAKPVDYPFGPYADNFSEQQHKYGPFEEMVKAKLLLQKKPQ